MRKQCIVRKLKGHIYLFAGLIFVFAAFGISAPAAADGELVGYWKLTNYLGNISCAEWTYNEYNEYTMTSPSIAAGVYTVTVIEDESFLVKNYDSEDKYPCWVWKITSDNLLENDCDYGSYYGDITIPTYCYFDTKMTRITDTGDSDEDGVMNGCDNCPTVSNPYQLDSNNDGIGDACSDIPQPLPPPEPFQAVPLTQIFKTDTVEFSLKFDENGNSNDVEACDGCVVTDIDLNKITLDGRPIVSFDYDKPWGGSFSPGCTYVRLRTGVVKKICPP